MSVVAVRRLSDETLRALKRRAARHGHSTEDEIREILDAAVRSEKRVRIGSELASLGKRFGGFDLKTMRDQGPTEPAVFE